MSAAGRHLLPVAVLVLLAAAIVGCAADQQTAATAGSQTALAQTIPTQSEAIDVQATAEAQATEIIRQAQATAILLQAQSEAKALVAGAEANQAQTEGREESEDQANGGSTLAPRQSSTPAPEGPALEILRVSFAAEGGFIMVSFKAAPKTADKFWPGQLSVIDEATGTVYNEVPVMPKIGPLISRPAVQGQVGYIMFVNTSPGLQPGSLVTVDLAGYKFEHIPVE